MTEWMDLQKRQKLQRDNKWQYKRVIEHSSKKAIT